MSSEHPTTPGLSTQDELNSTNRTLLDRVYDPRLLALSAILIPTAALSISYTLLRRHISRLQQELHGLRNANASLAREVREWKIHNTVGAAGSPPPTQSAQTSEAPLHKQLAVILPQLDGLSDKFKTTQDSLERRVVTETQRIRDLILSEAVAAARREGMTHAWQTQTTKRIALLMLGSSGTESQRSPEYKALRSSLLEVAALLKDVEKGQDPVLVEAGRWERMHGLSKQLDACLESVRRDLNERITWKRFPDRPVP